MRLCPLHEVEEFGVVLISVSEWRAGSEGGIYGVTKKEMGQVIIKRDCLIYYENDDYLHI